MYSSEWDKEILLKLTRLTDKNQPQPNFEYLVSLATDLAESENPDNVTVDSVGTVCSFCPVKKY